MTKTVFITGCSTGLGRSAALHFADKGWNVAATMRKPDASLASDQIAVLGADVTDPASIAAALAATEARFGSIDAVVNNAGVSIVSIFEATSMDEIRRVFETNVFGLAAVTQAAIPYLRKSHGALVNISSGVGFTATPLLSLYVASKHAVEGLSEALAYELESQDIRVKLVEPGAMRTTAFGTNTLGSSGSIPVPNGYRAYFDHMMGSMMNYPFPDAVEADVVARIYEAATDLSPRLRYTSGADTEIMAKLRWSTSEDEYWSTMQRTLGHAAWRDARG